MKRVEEDPFSLALHAGDMIAAITISDRKRFEAHDLAKWILIDDLDNLAVTEADHFVDIWKPIVPKTVGLLGGNHEAVLSKIDNHSIGQYIGEQLGADYLGDAGAALRLAFTRQGGGTTTYNGYVIHGWGGARTSSVKQGKLERMLLQEPDIDFLIMAHDHEGLFKEVYQKTYGSHKLLNRHRVGVIARTFQVHPRYAIKNGYPASYPGIVQLVFHPDTHGIGVRMED